MTFLFTSLRSLLFRIFYFYYRFKYRKYDDNLCMCGCEIGTGGDICHHGGCFSMKFYYINKNIYKFFNIINVKFREKLY